MTNLPVHPLTGLTAIGWRNARRDEDGEQPIWPQLGGSEDADDATDEAEQKDEEDESAGGDEAVEGEEALGDAGKRALDAMKASLRAEKARRKAAESDLAAAKAAVQQGTKKDDAPDLAAIEAAALEKARAETLRERALDRLEARAGRKNMADPSDARFHLAEHLDDFIDGSKIDTQAIDDALDELLEAKPYLAAATAKRFVGTGDGGARKGSTGPVQLTNADLKKMTPEAIDEALNKGQFDDLLGRKK